jgi:hypothetical protein
MFVSIGLYLDISNDEGAEYQRHGSELACVDVDTQNNLHR